MRAGRGRKMVAEVGSRDHLGGLQWEYQSETENHNGILKQMRRTALISFMTNMVRGVLRLYISHSPSGSIPVWMPPDKWSPAPSNNIRKTGPTYRRAGAAGLKPIRALYTSLNTTHRKQTRARVNINMEHRRISEWALNWVGRVPTYGPPASTVQHPQGNA